MNIKFDKKEKSMNIKNKRGITLVSLVITIIILLILTGIGINALKQTNLFEQSKQAKNSMSNAQNIENNTLLSYESMINGIIGNRENEEHNVGTNIEKIELIGTNLGTNITIPVGVKYVIVSNTYWTRSGINCVNSSKLSSNTNSTILTSQSSSSYIGSNGSGTWVIFAKIDDISQSANLTFTGSDYNIVYAIK